VFFSLFDSLLFSYRVTALLYREVRVERARVRVVKLDSQRTSWTAGVAPRGQAYDAVTAERLRRLRKASVISDKLKTLLAGRTITVS